MTFWENLQETINEGIAASKILLANTAQAVKDLGHEGALRFEILQLKNQAEKLSAKLGARVYQLLREQNVKAIDGTEELIAPILEQIEAVKLRIEQKTEQLNRKASS